MKKAINWLALLVTLGMLVVAQTGCRTAEGFGEDMENAGEKIQEKAN